MLTIITPTGERPFAFGLCQRMMERQSYSGPVRWIVVDDGEIPTAVTFKRKGWTLDVIRPTPAWTFGDNTQGRNLSLGLDTADPKSLIVFVEDDDWYHNHWLDKVVFESKKAELVGEADAVYYNVRQRRCQLLGNEHHASLRCSAIRGKAIDTFRDVLSTPYHYYDQRLWKRHEDRRVFRSRLTVGIKGMPGRAGIALGHEGLKGKHDPDGTFLRSLIGGDADWYMPLYEEINMTKFVVVKPFRYARRDWKAGEEFIPVKKGDAEIFVHAKKVRRETAVPAPVPVKPKKMKVETQTQKLAEAIVEKTPETPVDNSADPVEAPAQETAADDDKPRKRGRLSIGI